MWSQVGMVMWRGRTKVWSARRYCVHQKVAKSMWVAPRLTSTT